MGDMEGRQEPRRERLEVPSSSSIERRLLVGDAAPRRPRSKPAIKAVPPSGLLGRLQAFLPTLEAANADLQQQLASGAGAEEVAMERGSDDEREGPYVEMDLACGLFDLKDETAVAAAEAALVSRGVAVEKYGGASSDSDSDTDSSSSSEGEGGSSREDEEEGVAGGAAAEATGPAEEAAAAMGREAMEEDGPNAESLGSQGTVGREAGAGTAAAPGRRRKKHGKQHAGIVELS